MNNHVSNYEHTLGGGDALLLILPGNAVEHMPLGPYLLQAVAKQQGYKVDVWHLDALLAKNLGPEVYQLIQNSQSNAYFQLLWARLFARSAFGLPALGHDHHLLWDQEQATHGLVHANVYNDQMAPFTETQLLTLEAQCYTWVQDVLAEYVMNPYPVVGAAIGYECQLHAGISILNGIKAKDPTVTTIMGGGYFDDYGREEGVLSLPIEVDHLLVGEAEDTFIQILDAVSGKAKPPTERVIRHTEGRSLKGLPLADYDAYANQITTILGKEYFDTQVQVLWYESNRGCWWGDKSRCTFCSIPEAIFRRKDTKQVVADLQEIQKKYPDKVVLFADNIIVDEFTDEVLALAPDSNTLPKVGFQLKVGKTLDYVTGLHRINTRWALPGVESFSTSLLKRMKKGTKGKDNLYFLRNACSYGIALQYHLLWGFPGDIQQEYDYLLELAPKLSHLQPVAFFTYALIGRGSPLFEHAESLGVQDKQAWQAYHAVYPTDADIFRLTHYFKGVFTSAAYEQPELIAAIGKVLQDWKDHYHKSYLQIKPLGTEYVIHDCRATTNYLPVHHPIDEVRAKKVMTLAHHDTMDVHQQWALQRNLGVVMDDYYVPLVTAEGPLLEHLDHHASWHQQGQPMMPTA
ncbi:MAG TPA: hypothetical protein DCE41_16240 [Cytophagales bacterium]|nr:hypothetical protein [Cytophagales bacterium]HAA23611.1 hypothetical protein [Cytophagales bacterium]HAP60753.1 hypothetical protein [Cytophagales bacterium]